MSESRQHATGHLQQQNRFDVAIVDQSEDAMDAARDAAEERLTDELNADGGKLQRFARAVWKGNIAKEYYRQQYILEAHKKIVDTNDIYVHTDAQDIHKTDALNATIDRFVQDAAEVRHDEAGESHEVLAEDDELAVITKDLVRKYASGAIDEAALREEQSRIIGAYQAAHGGDAAKRGMVQVDNILQVARAVKGAVEHGESLDAVTREMNVSVGVARNSVRTSHTKTWTDKAIEKVGKSKIGRLSFVTPDMIVAGTSIAASVARVGSTSLLGAAAKTLVPGAAAGVIAGAREARQVRKERVQHMREMAQGAKFDESSKRRKEMEENRYDTRSAKDETERLQAFVDFEDFQNGDPAAIKDTLHVVSELQSRIRQSDADGIDRLTYTSVVSVGQERMELDLALAKAKVALVDKFTTVDTAVLSRELGMDVALPIDQLVEQTSQLYEDEGRREVTDKDEVFKKLRRKRVLGKAAVGVASGILIGATMQEALAAVSPTRVGLIDNITQQDTQLHEGRAHTTLAERMREALPFDDNQLPDYGPEVSHIQDGHGTLDIAGGTATIEDGKMKLVSADGNLTVVDIPLNGDGSVSDEVRQQLEAQGIKVGEPDQVSTEKIVTETRPADANGYVQHYMDQTTRIVRDRWYDNNTNGFDQNELGLWSGGENYRGLNADGSLGFSVAAMSPDGSFTGEYSVEWQQAAESGNLKFAISASEGTQTHPFMIDVNPDGSINIPPDHPAAKLFSVQDGQVVFHGAYGEVVQTVGTNTDGADLVRPLATIEGDQTFNGAPIEVTEKVAEDSYITPITMPETERFTEMAPVVPVTGRRSMERTKSDGYYNRYDNMSYNEEQQFLRKEISPRLHDDPRAILDPARELKWYRKNILDRKGKDYMEEVNRAISNSPELKSPSEGLRAIVTIPVHASSEADNIYKTLSLYGQQTADKDSFTVMLHLNWFDSEESDPAKMLAIEKTKAEIERARHDFPDLSVAIIESTWEQAKKDSGAYGNGIIGHVSRKMYDTAMMSVEAGIASGSLKDRDVLLIRNDADAEGMDRRYIEQMTKHFVDNPQGDVFTGAIRWGTKRHKDLPGFAFVSNFREVMHIATQRKGVNEWSPTVGINTAMRMSTFAAVGGVGSDAYNTGIGSDDYAIGGRINTARNPNYSRYKGGYPIRTRWSRARRIASRVGGRRITPHSSEQDQGNSSANGDSYQYHRHVPGATVDTSPDRLEAAYLNPRVGSTTDAWDDWDNKQRSEGVEALRKKYKEDIRRNPNAIVSHVEQDISGSLSHRFHNRAHVDAGLAMMLPVTIHGVPSYEITGSGKNQKFEFTPEGKKWFISRLGYDKDGNYDPIGRRVRRQKYHEDPAGNRLATRKAPFVQ